jgi:hypothetical protein
MAKNAMTRFNPTPIGITLPENLEWKDWRVLFEGYGYMARSIPWVVGDLIVYGEDHYGEEVAQAMSEIMAKTRYGRKTIYNLVYVSRNVLPENRNPALTHSHHYEVAKLDAEEQREWLGLAELEGWTVRQLRAHINGEKVEDKPIEAEAVFSEDKSEDEVEKELTNGEINDQFDAWWMAYSAGAGYREEEKAIAMDAWNASITEG